MKKLLIANRGEIAVRIMKTAHRMGVSTVAVATEADSQASHVAIADEVCFIGENLVNESYLNIEKILDTAKKTGADAIHPGYGFLSENADFASAVIAAGFVWVGPPVDSIKSMGDKAAAKERMRSAGVPMPKGYFGDQSFERLQVEAQNIGFPLLVKAVAGGGGRGIRIVREGAELKEAIERAQSEALSAFASSEIMLEQFLEKAKHIEIQVFADQHGNAVHLFERDCSTQRRRQKIIEEAPSASIDHKMRQRMGETAAKAAAAIGYVGAGTLEFLVVGDEFYFLEMNTRLQVEHPVTELITGLDLVEWQLRIAEGEPLPLNQDQICFDGHAIEARIYAEDPANNYMPSTGKILYWNPPTEENIRIDSGIQQGQEVSSYYDPMLAKIIAYGHDRESAIRQLSRAIQQSVLIGPKTNHGFLTQVLLGEDFRSANMHTTRLEELDFPAESPEIRAWLVAAILASSPRKSPWNSRGQSRWKQRLLHAQEEKCFQLSSGGQKQIISVDDEQHDYVVVDRQQNTACVRIGNHQTNWTYVLHNDSIWLWDRGWNYHFQIPSNEPDQDSAADDSNLRSPMSGRVVAVLIESGVTVSKGDKVVVIEAMKMEHPIFAGSDGRLTIHCAVGDQVQTHQIVGVIGEENG